MKRVITSSTNYDERLSGDWLQVGNVRFSGYIDHNPTERPMLMPRFQLSEIHPYDLQEYVWARRNDRQSNRVDFYRNGKLVDTMLIADYDPDDYDSGRGPEEDFNEYVSDILGDVMRELRDLNRKYEPRMDHT